MGRRETVAATVLALVTAGCAASGDCVPCDACAACETCAACQDASCPGADVPEEAAADVPVDPASDAEAEADPPAPTYWSPEATKTVDDVQFVTVKDPKTGESKRLFALGVHPSHDGGWDGITGANGCHRDEATGLVVGTTNDGVEQLHLAAEAGANFVYTWGYGDDPEYKHVDPPFWGTWHREYGTLDAQYGPGHEEIPVVVCDHGETDMGGYKPEKVAELTNDFADFKARTGRYSKENAPTLPPYEDLPWYCWHPTFRMKGGGDGKGEVLTDAQATEFARTTNMMIGDTYSYVCNRFNEIEGMLYGQIGPENECYEDWLARDDPAHRPFFSAAWDLAHSLREKANPEAVVWMWIQGHAFDDDIGGSVCWNGSSSLWAKGPFPTQRYLRKEILSTIVAGGTGFVYFGYGYGKASVAEKARIPIRALAMPEVYGPALLSPRLDLGADLAHAGEGGRAHLMAKWDAVSQRAFVIGANPGSHETPVELQFPWSVAKVEVLDWFTPQFEDATDVAVDDRFVRFVAPEDDGFLLRVTPLFAPGDR